MRAGGEKRGNSRDRARRRAWLLETFDPDLGPKRARCHLKISDRCRGVLDRHSLTVDRIQPGGSYRRSNIRPACSPCQNRQGALITHERRLEWISLQEEAAYYGVEEGMDEETPEPCAYETRPATWIDPPEFCEEDAVPGSEFCERHDPDAYDDWLIEQAEARKEDGR